VSLKAGETVVNIIVIKTQGLR